MLRMQQEADVRVMKARAELAPTCTAISDFSAALVSKLDI